MSDRRRTRIEQSPWESIGAMSALLTIIGLLAYACAWSAYAMFYGRLGLTPFAVGLGYQPILTRAVMGALLMALAVAVIVLTLYPGRLFLDANTNPRLWSGQSVVIAAVIAISMGSLAYLIAVNSQLSEFWVLLPAWLGAVASIYIAKAGIHHIGRLLPPRRSKPLHDRFSLTFTTWLSRLRYSHADRRLALVVVICGYVLLEGFALWTGYNDAGKVINNRPLNAVVLGYRADYVAELTPASDSLPKTFSPPADLRYLGASDGVTIFYNTRRKRPVRVPSAVIILATR